MDSFAASSPVSGQEGQTGFFARLRGSLAAKVSIAIGVIGTLLAVAFAAAGAALVREHELDRYLSRIDELLSTIESTVQIACFASEAALAKEVARGLLTNPAIAAVHIASDQQTLVNAVKKNMTGRDSRRVRKAIFSPFDTHMPVGEIVLETDNEYILAQAGGYSILFAKLLLLEIITFALAVALLVLYIVIRPITRFADDLHGFDGRFGAYLQPPKGDEKNEIGRLAGAFNRMIDGLASLLDKERAMREKVARSELRFRTLAENFPDIILRYSSDLHLLFANPAYLREVNARRAQLPGGGRGEFIVWLPTMPREQYLERIRRVIETGLPDSMLWEWQSPSGRSIFHEMSVVAEYDGKRNVVGALVIGRNITERKEIEGQLIHQATHDVLTGLPNRALLKDRLQHAIAQARHEGHRLALIFIDVDHFKDVNDSLGHDIGDQLLKILAGRMLATLPENDTVARLGGDEFVVLLEGSASGHDWDAAVQRIHEAIAQPCDIGEQHIFPSASMGIAVYPQDGEDVDTLMRNADTAMYVAKGEGRKRYRFFAADMNEELHEWMKLTGDLHLAVENQEFVLHYQPKVHIDTGEVVGLEALIRWHHPGRGPVSPAVFIPAAEKTGLIGAIGQWVLNEACRQAKAWLDEGLDPGRVAVNLSAVQCEGALLPLQVRHALAAHRLPAEHLEVEITESIVMADTEESTSVFWALRDMGIRISVDDFGTGYSSLSYLKRLPVDTLKIDKSFIDDIETDANDMEIIRAIVAMAHSLKLAVIAEGVETAAQLEFLRGIGCDQLQGYYFSRPRPAGEISAMLRDRARPAPIAQQRISP